jgi:glutamate carboxypeptidase
MMTENDSLFEKIQSLLISRESSMFALLKELVLIQSGSYNKKGVDEVARRIAHVFKNDNVVTEIIEQNSLGNHLVVRSPCRSSGSNQILFVGHTDTVFPIDTDFNWYKEDDSNCYGPGVVDMKGGLVAGIFALKTLGDLGLLEQIPLAFIFNADEEIGSRSSIDLIQREASRSAFAFLLESGGLDNQIVTGRKGILTVELHVVGEAGHAAVAERNKASAILELAHKTIAFESLNDFERGITVNVGTVQGGIGPNTVPEYASAQVDFRYMVPQDLKYLEEKVSAISKKTTVHGTETRVDFISGRPPMQQSRASRELYHTVAQVADHLGYPVEEEFRFGGSDANFIADLNVPVIDGLGPIGGRDHSRDEYMIKQSLLQRAILLTCSIVECWKAYGGTISPA